MSEIPQSERSWLNILWVAVREARIIVAACTEPDGVCSCVAMSELAESTYFAAAEVAIALVA